MDSTLPGVVVTNPDALPAARTLSAVLDAWGLLDDGGLTMEWRRGPRPMAGVGRLQCRMTAGLLPWLRRLAEVSTRRLPVGGLRGPGWVIEWPTREIDRATAERFAYAILMWWVWRSGSPELLAVWADHLHATPQPPAVQATAPAMPPPASFQPLAVSTTTVSQGLRLPRSGRPRIEIAPPPDTRPRRRSGG
jgi:hypothetical protein